jgi:predicted small lipoprotein YifL
MTRNRLRLASLAAIAALLGLLAGCGGQEGELETPSAATATQPAATAEPSVGQGGVLPSAEDARDELQRMTLLVNDLGAGYVVLSDEYADNAQASAAQPDPAVALTFLNSAGRVLGRTVTYIAADTTGAAVAGQSVAFFSNVNVFGDAAGAAQYYAVSIQLMAEGTGVAAQLGDLFADPAAVQVAPVAFSPIGDQSQAFTLAGQTEAGGQLYPVVALLAVVQRGPVTAFVGSVRVAIPPDVQEVERLAGLLVARIDSEF